MTKKDFIRKITSRKFWAFVAEFVAALLIFLKVDKATAESVASLIMLAISPIAYMFAEAVADANRVVTSDHADDEELKPPEIDAD